MLRSLRSLRMQLNCGPLGLHGSCHMKV